MNAWLSTLTVFIVLLLFSFVQTHPCLGHFSEGPLSLLAKNEESPAREEDSKPGPIPAIEEYERQKLAKLRQNVGKLFLTARPSILQRSTYLRMI